MMRYLSLIVVGIYLLLCYGAYAQQVTPRACDISVVTTGGTAVTSIIGTTIGYYITNPLLATDQGLGAAENLYVNIVDTATTTGNIGTTTLVPGQTFYGVGLSRNSVSVNATTSGHTYSCARW